MSSIDTALSLAARGLPCLPLRPGAKAPACPHGVKDATTDPEKLRALFRRAPWDDAEKGVGLACGDVVALDLDLDPAKGIDGAAALERSPLAGHLPRTLSQRTPRGGRHLIYRWPEGTVQPRNGVGVLPGVDIRSAGGYVKVYALDDTPIAEAPQELVSFLLAPRGSPDGQAALGLPPKSPRPWEPHASPPAEAVVVDRARCYLSCCAAAIQGQHGHSSLLWAAHALVVGFDLPDGDALRLLWEEYNPRCVPPWDPLNAADRKDFERKVSEARRNPGAHRFGYLRDAVSTTAAPDPAPALVAEGAAIARPLLASPASPAPTSQPGGSVAEPPVVVTSPDGQSAIGLPPSPAPAPWPADLLDPPGLVGEIARYILAGARIPQPGFAIGAALAVCSILMGRKVQWGEGEEGSLTSLYILLVGESSCGKDAPQKAVRRILHKCGADDLKFNDPTSRAAVEALFKESPARILCQDEIGHIFRQMGAEAKSGGSAGGLEGLYLEMYSAGKGEQESRSYAEKEKKPKFIVQRPSLTILGATTPAKLFGEGGMSREQIEGGFYPRFLVFWPEPDAQQRRVRVPAVPPAIVERCAAWLAWDPPAWKGMGDLEAATEPHPFPMPVAAEAEGVLADYEAECRRRRAEEAKAERAGALYWGKAGELAERVALILAAGRCEPGSALAAVEATDAQWAASLVRHVVGRMAAETEDKVVESPHAAARRDILRAVAKWAGAGGWATKSAINRATQRINQRQRNDYLEELVESGRLECAAAPSSGGRKPALYRIPASPS